MNVSKCIRVTIFSYLILILAYAAWGAERSLSDILSAYVRANGGAWHLSRFDSVCIEGTQIQGGEEFHFELRKKRPDCFRFSLSRADLTTIAGYDGVSPWAFVETEIAGARPISLNPFQQDMIKAEARFDHPLIEAYQDNGNTIHYMGRVDLEGRPCYLVEWMAAGGNRVRYYLDSLSFFVICRECLGSEESVPVLRTIYSDYRNIRGYNFAFRVENYLDGSLVTQQTISRVLVNPGILSFYFEKPKFL